MSDKRQWFVRLARRYVRRRLRREFHAVWGVGVDRFQALVREGPVIVAANHVAWWDPFLLVHLEEAVEGNGYCLMDAGSLRKLPFFRWLGALPLDRSSTRAAYRDLQRASGLLVGPRRFLVVFPQGKQRPAHLPLEFQPGIAHLAFATQVPVIPMAIRYDFFEHPRADVHISLGRPLRAEINPRPSEAEILEFVRRVEAGVLAELRRVDRHFDGYGGFVPLLGRREDLHESAALPRAATPLGLLADRSAR